MMSPIGLLRPTRRLRVSALIATTLMCGGCLGLFGTASRGLPGNLRGTVVEKSTSGGPIAGASVLLDGIQSTQTNAFGRFAFANVPAGAHRVTVSTSGYENGHVWIDVDGATDVDIALRPLDGSRPAATLVPLSNSTSVGQAVDVEVRLIRPDGTAAVAGRVEFDPHAWRYTGHSLPGGTAHLMLVREAAPGILAFAAGHRNGDGVWNDDAAVTTLSFEALSTGQHGFFLTRDGFAAVDGDGTNLAPYYGVSGSSIDVQ